MSKTHHVFHEIKRVFVFELLPQASTRSTSLGVSHNIVAIIGGLNPTFCAFLIERGYSVKWIGAFDIFYTAIVLVTFGAVYCWKDQIVSNPVKLENKD